jgi:AcrR family transcriptional regulator
MCPQQERIVVGARELFFRHGLKSITMDDIAAHLGISKKTIYQFYKEKDALIQEIATLEIQEHDQEMQRIRKQSKDSIEEILLAMKSVSHMMNKISPTVFYDMQKYYPKGWEIFREFKMATMTNYVEENLRRGIRQELYRKELNLKIMARLRIEEVEMGYNPIAFPPDKFNITEVQIAMLDHFLHGIVTLKGHKLISKYKQIKDKE